MVEHIVIGKALISQLRAKGNNIRLFENQIVRLFQVHFAEEQAGSTAKYIVKKERNTPASGNTEHPVYLFGHARYSIMWLLLVKWPIVRAIWYLFDRNGGCEAQEENEKEDEASQGLVIVVILSFYCSFIT